jgi:hypothetical protein
LEQSASGLVARAWHWVKSARFGRAGALAVWYTVHVRDVRRCGKIHANLSPLQKPAIPTAPFVAAFARDIHVAFISLNAH